MVKCFDCDRKAEFIVYDTKKKIWCLCCPECIEKDIDLIVPQNLIDQICS